jgi:hypothetical protein
MGTRSRVKAGGAAKAEFVEGNMHDPLPPRKYSKRPKKSKKKRSGKDISLSLIKFHNSCSRTGERSTRRRKYNKIEQ